VEFFSHIRPAWVFSNPAGAELCARLHLKIRQNEPFSKSETLNLGYRKAVMLLPMNILPQDSLNLVL
jgi:hypothetical protein